jgi:hypothetical protein
VGPARSQPQSLLHHTPLHTRASYSFPCYLAGLAGVVGGATGGCGGRPAYLRYMKQGFIKPLGNPALCFSKSPYFNSIQHTCSYVYLPAFSDPRIGALWRRLRDPQLWRTFVSGMRHWKLSVPKKSEQSTQQVRPWCPSWGPMIYAGSL